MRRSPQMALKSHLMMVTTLGWSDKFDKGGFKQQSDAKSRFKGAVPCAKCTAKPLCACTAGWSGTACATAARCVDLLWKLYCGSPKL